MTKKRTLDEVNKKNCPDGGKSKVNDYGRRVWDKQYYKQKVEEKSEDDEEELISKLIPEYKKKKLPPAVNEKKLLEGRKDELSLDENLGKVRILTLKTPKNDQGGYYCELCDCVLKDSQTYLDHINGKNHNRMLGFSMKVKKVTVDEVKNKLEFLKNKKGKQLSKIAKNPYEEAKKIAQQLELEQQLKRERNKKKRMLKKLEKERGLSNKKESEDEHNTEEEEKEKETEEKEAEEKEAEEKEAEEKEAEEKDAEEKEKETEEKEKETEEKEKETEEKEKEEEMEEKKKKMEKKEIIEKGQDFARTNDVGVVETELIIDDLSLEMEKMGLPTTFV